MIVCSFEFRARHCLEHLLDITACLGPWSSTGSVKKQEGDKDIEKEYLRADIMEAEADADEDEIDLDGNFSVFFKSMIT